MARPRAFSKTPSPSAMAGDALAAPPMAPTSFPATASPARPAFGKKPAKNVKLLPVPLITKANLKDYPGWVKE